MTWRYLIPIIDSAKQLLVLKVPESGRGTGVTWRELVGKELSSVLRFYGHKKRDLFSLDGSVDPTLAKQAFAGDATKLHAFDLWEWDIEERQYKLVRKATLTEPNS